MKKWLLAIVFGSALVLGACGGNDDASDNKDNSTDKTETTKPSTPGSVDSTKAEELYSSNCSQCHGADLSGGAGPDLRDVGSKLSKEQIETTIKKGKGGMPGNIIKDDADRDTLASWLAAKK